MHRQSGRIAPVSEKGGMSVYRHSEDEPATPSSPTAHFSRRDTNRRDMFGCTRPSPWRRTRDGRLTRLGVSRADPHSEFRKTPTMPFPNMQLDASAPVLARKQIVSAGNVRRRFARDFGVANARPPVAGVS
jgi:hypothetical protein